MTRGLPSASSRILRRLEVAVDDAARVGVVHRLGDLPHERGRAAAAGAARRRGPSGQARPVDEAHAEVVLPVVLADLVDRHDAGMVEVGRGLGLGAEPRDVGLVGELPGQDHLEGDGPVEAQLPGLVDDAHAAAGDLAKQLVVAEATEHAGPDRRPSLRRVPRTTVVERSGLVGA